MRFELYREAKGDWRWRLRTRNGDVVADSAAGYRNREDCERGIAIVKACSLSPIADMTIQMTESEETPLQAAATSRVRTP
jgi:uncharacterized protein YegP (UPF0339 family)